MGFMDKIKNKLQEGRGRAKEHTGRATDDPGLERQGRADRGGANFKQAGEHLKDSVAEIRRSFKKN